MILILTLLATTLITTNIQAANNNAHVLAGGRDWPVLQAFKSSKDSSRYTSPSDMFTEPGNSKSYFDFWKEAKGRRAFVMHRETSVFYRMGPLSSTEGYTIRMYRRKKHYIPQVTTFPSTTDSFHSLSKGGTFSHLIQSYPDSDPSKKLCIFTQNDLPDYTALERFTKGMITSMAGGTQDAYFKLHKGEIGLPTGFETFDYNVYAWVSSVDCAFYNLGAPEYLVNPPGHAEPSEVKQALTEVLGENAGTNLYSIQVSRMFAETIPVTVIKVDKNTELKIKPFNYFYRTFNSLYNTFQGLRVLNVETEKVEKTKEIRKARDASCNAFFFNGQVRDIDEAVDILKEAVDLYRESNNIRNLRLVSFNREKNYNDLFSLFPQSDSVTLASWTPTSDGSCNFPESVTRTASYETDIPAKDSDDDSDFEELSADGIMDDDDFFSYSEISSGSDKEWKK